MSSKAHTVVAVLLFVISLGCDRNHPVEFGPVEPEFENDFGMLMVLLPSGEFTMGSPESEPGRDSDETPRRVILSQSMYVAAFEVTQKQWERVMGTVPARHIGTDRPVDSVSFEDALDFAAKVSEQTGHTYRLPTEAEWEFACRAGTTTAYHTGERLRDTDATFRTWPADGSARDIEGTTEVGSHEPNAWGLYDMHGNVWEWAVAENGSGVLRGGAWSFSATAARCAARLELAPDRRYDVNGLRLVMER